MNKNNVVAVIPARGGSKRVPHKNIRDFLGKPLLAYTIEAALAARTVNRVIVSTDDEEIASVAKKYNAEVPFLRPAELSEDSVADFPVIEHAVKWLAEKEGWKAEVVVFLRPTCIFRRSEDIDQIVNKLIQTGKDSVRSISQAVYSPYWMKRTNGDQLVPFIESEYTYRRSQELPPVFQCNGTIDAVRAETILMKKKLYGGNIGYLESKDEFATIDIDTELDFILAETAYKQWRRGAAE